jgi:hypothetical protein
VNGTAAGMDIHEQTAITAVKSAISVRSLMLNDVLLSVACVDVLLFIS